MEIQDNMDKKLAPAERPSSKAPSSYDIARIKPQIESLIDNWNKQENNENVTDSWERAIGKEKKVGGLFKEIREKTLGIKIDVLSNELKNHIDIFGFSSEKKEHYQKIFSRAPNIKVFEDGKGSYHFVPLIVKTYELIGLIDSNYANKLLQMTREEIIKRNKFGLFKSFDPETFESNHHLSRVKSDKPKEGPFRY